VTRTTRSDGPARLGDVLRTALARVPEADRLADHAVWAHWDEVVGPTVARHARPARLGRGVLVVAVDSPGWMQELQFLKHDLRERLNARLGRRAVRDLFLVLETEP
jgi:predicted nucleic acid-binding Zn ribbon protein